jgi:hypothetical protein
MIYYHISFSYHFVILYTFASTKHTKQIHQLSYIIFTHKTLESLILILQLLHIK